MVDSSCFVATSTWLEEGWQVVRQIANFERDYLLPAPCKNFKGCRRMELKYDAGFALQNRIVSWLTLEGSAHIPPQLTGFWTPHSGRSFMPSCCAALQFPLGQRNYLGGWSAEGSDRYARVAALRIRSLQGAVVRSIQAGPEGDPLREQETLSHLQQYGEDKKVQPDEMVPLIRNLETWQPHRAPRAAAVLEMRTDDDVGLLQIRDEDDGPVDPEEHAQKKRRGGNAQARTEALGDNPREARARIRQTLQPGFYVCRAGKKRTRVLHQLGACYALPNIDYLDCTHMGEKMPSRSQYDVVCRLCTRRGIDNEQQVSSETVTSSSSDEHEA